MTEKLLKSLINKLNKGSSKTLFHLRPLTDKVVLGKVWLIKPKSTDIITHPDWYHSFYFIKDEKGTYIAIILDMGHDLHWFVLPKYRGKGYLTTALKEVILFHLFQNRQEQRITIKESDIGRKNFIASENVAKNVGFIKVEGFENYEYILTIDKYQTDNFIDGFNSEISQIRFEQLKRQMNYIARSLWVVQTELEMKLGDYEYSEEIKDTVQEIKRHIDSLDYIWWENQNK